MKLLNTIICCSALLGAGTAMAKSPVWTDPVKAAAEDPDFLIQGEYTAKGRGIQVAAMGKGEFLISEYEGGLPGAGWNGKGLKQRTGDSGKVKKAVSGLTRQERKPTSLGAKPPEGALVLFDGKDASQWKDGKVENGLLAEGTITKEDFKDFKIHLEFRLPYKPEAPLTSQDRGNSGIYIFGNYECQIIDSFGLDYSGTSKALKNHSDTKQWCGCLYKFKLPDASMCLPPLAWQSYDIEFTAPRFVDGKKTSNAEITVWLNGVKIHDKVNLPKGTGAGGNKPEKAAGPIQLQGHGNPVAFRNIWIVKK